MENSEIEVVEKQYRNKITLISFILAILVLIRHAHNVNIYNITGVFANVQDFFGVLTDIAVPTFFMLSGYLFFVNFNYSVLLKKWKKRIFSILIPYLIWSLISYLYFLLLSYIPKISENINNNKIVFSFKDMIKSVIIGKYNVFWFLQYLMVYIVLAPAFFPIIKNKYIGYIPALLLLIIGFLADKFTFTQYANNGLIGWFLNKELYSYFTLYLLGAYFGACYKDRIISLKFNKIYCIISLIAIIIIALLRVITKDFATKIFSLYYVIMAIQSILVWIGLDFLRVNKCSWIFKNSFFIYCTHSLILETIEKLFLLVFKKTLFGALLDFVFAPIITYVIILAIIYVFSKYLPKVWKVLCGGR